MFASPNIALPSWRTVEPSLTVAPSSPSSSAMLKSRGQATSHTKVLSWLKTPFFTNGPGSPSFDCSWMTRAPVVKMGAAAVVRSAALSCAAWMLGESKGGWKESQSKFSVFSKQWQWFKWSIFVGLAQQWQLCDQLASQKGSLQLVSWSDAA